MGRPAIGLEEFINRARYKHGDKFDYSMVRYIRTDCKVTLICPDHGVFNIAPSDHLKSKYGCGKCGKKGSGDSRKDVPQPGTKYWKHNTVEKYSEEGRRHAHLYLMEFKALVGSEHFWKVGITTCKNPSGRIDFSMMGNYKVTVIDSIETNLHDAQVLEGRYHEEYCHLQHVPEHWFSGYTECFGELVSIREHLDNGDTK